MANPFKKSHSGLPVPYLHTKLKAKSSIALRDTHIEDEVMPQGVPYTIPDNTFDTPLMESLNLNRVRTPDDTLDDFEDLEDELKGTNHENRFENSCSSVEFQHYRSYTLASKTVPRNFNSRNKPRHYNNYNKLISDTRRQTINMDYLNENTSFLNADFKTTDSSGYLVEPEDSIAPYSILSPEVSVSQAICDNLSETHHILFNKETKDNYLSEDSYVPLIATLSSPYKERKLRNSMFANKSVDPYLIVKEELVEILEEFSSTSQARGDPTPARDAPHFDNSKLHHRLGEDISIPYLSPLVLRKSLENLISKEGHGILNNSEVVFKAPIIFWNLVSFTSNIKY